MAVVVAAQGGGTHPDRGGRAERIRARRRRLAAGRPVRPLSFWRLSNAPLHVYPPPPVFAWYLMTGGWPQLPLLPERGGPHGSGPCIRVVIHAHALLLCLRGCRGHSVLAPSFSGSLQQPLATIEGATA